MTTQREMELSYATQQQASQSSTKWVTAIWLTVSNAARTLVSNAITTAAGYFPVDRPGAFSVGVQ
jgi:hypothetical protein